MLSISSSRKMLLVGCCETVNRYFLLNILFNNSTWLSAALKLTAGIFLVLMKLMFCFARAGTAFCGKPVAIQFTGKQHLLFVGQPFLRSGALLSSTLSIVVLS